MKKLIIAGLLAATVAPTVASAQVSDRDRRELRDDRRDVRDQRQDVREAYRNGDPRAIRDERHDLRDARHELRDDRHDARQDYRRDYGRDDWRGYREANRDLYRGGVFRSTYGYRAFQPGYRIGAGYYAPQFVIADYGRYRLHRPGFNQRWVRHYNDVLLIDSRRGIVVESIRGFYR